MLHQFVQPGIEPQVRVYAEAEEKYVYLWVEDNGIGIAERSQERMFGLFDRLHAQQVYPGTGIGLAIANQGVDRMGGAIGLKSTLGIGTRFWVKLRKSET